MCVWKEFLISFILTPIYSFVGDTVQSCDIPSTTKAPSPGWFDSKSDSCLEDYATCSTCVTNPACGWCQGL